MRWYLVAILGYVFAVLQTSLFKAGLLAVQPFQAWLAPDLLIIMALFVAFFAMPGEVFIVAWCLGLAEDLLMVERGPLGLTAMLLGGLAWALSLTRRGLTDQFFESKRIQFLTALVFVLVLRLVRLLIIDWHAPTSRGPWFILERACGDALYTALLTPYLIWLLRKLIVTRAAQRSHR